MENDNHIIILLNNLLDINDHKNSSATITLILQLLFPAKMK